MRVTEESVYLSSLNFYLSTQAHSLGLKATPSTLEGEFT